MQFNVLNVVNVSSIQPAALTAISNTTIVSSNQKYTCALSREQHAVNQTNLQCQILKSVMSANPSRSSQRERGGRGRRTAQAQPTVTTGNKRGSSSRGSATRSKRPRQNDGEGVLTRNDIPVIVAAVLDASRTGNGAATASTDPPPSTTTRRTSPRMTPPQGTTGSTHPTAVEEIEHQELGEQPYIFTLSTS